MIKFCQNVFKKSFILIFVLPFMLAASEEKTQGMDKLLKIIQFEESVQASIDFAVETILENYPDQKQNESEIKKILGECINIDNMRKDIIEIYTNLFTKEEIEEMISFYETKVGKKILEKNPEITSFMMERTQGSLTKGLEKLDELFPVE